jgi:membrane fusion protein, multidrug efflux system
MNHYLLPHDDAPTLTPMYRVTATARLRVSLEWLRRRYLLLVGALTVALAVAGIANYWSSARFVVSTNDAYVQADSTIVASRVSGYVSAVMIQDHQSVKAGQVLALIDDRDFRAALDQARADDRAAQAAVDDLQAQLTEQATLIVRARAGVDESQAALELARLNQVRYRKMAGIGFGSEQQSQQADAEARERSADLARDRAVLASAHSQVRVLQAKLAQAQALRDRSQAVEHRAALQLGYTTITAPIAGMVGARTVRLGQYVQAGTQLTALVPLREVYIMANFKETQLTRVRAGEPVRVHVDTFPGIDLHACVDSLAPASGLEFSLLPPDNATGNFTKIVQRIPVKIRFDSSEPLAGRLRPGMSVEASVDTNPAASRSPCRAPQL